MPKVSVIIPVFNAECYIERCARSLFEQTLTDIEFIFVNDYSQDNGIYKLKQILSEYPQRQPQVQIIDHKFNKGSAAARNTGLKMSIGKYIIHCDADDWVEKDTYERMYEAAIAGNACIVISNYFLEYAGKSRLCVQNVRKNDDLVALLLSSKLHGANWNKLILRNLLIDNSLWYVEGINMWEDLIMSVKACCLAKNIILINEAFYHYNRQNLHSYCNIMSYSSLKNMQSAISEIETFLSNKNILHRYTEELGYLKLSAKFNILLYSRGDLQKYWNQQYLETSHLILSFNALSLYWRIALLFAKVNLLWVFNLMVSIRKFLRSFCLNL